MSLLVHGASWVLLDSAGAATCSATSALHPRGMGVAKPARRSHRTRRCNDRLYAAAFASQGFGFKYPLRAVVAGP